MIKLELHRINFFQVSLSLGVIVLVCALMITPYYKLSLLVAPLLLMAALSMYRRQQINLIFYIIIFLIPFGEYRKIGGVNLPWVLAVAVLAVAAIDVVMGKLRLGDLSARLWFYLIPMLLVNFISTALSPYKETSIDAMKNWLAAYFFIGLMLLLMNSRGVFKNLPGWIIASVTLSAFLAVIGTYLGLWSEWFTKEDRGTGGAPDPNNLSLMIIFAIPMIMHYLLHAKSVLMRVGMSSLLFINIMGIFSTNSRSGMLVAGLVAMIMLFVNSKKIKARYVGLIIPVISLAVIALPIVMPQKALERLMTITATHQDRSMLRRSSYLDVGMRAYIQRPVIGYGPFTFQHLFAESREARLYQRGDATLLRQAHNTYLEILVGSGTLGMILFLGVIIQAHVNFFQAKKLLLRVQMVEYYDLVTSFQVSFSGLLVYLAVFSDPYHKDLLIMLPLSELVFRYARNFNLTSGARIESG